MKSALRGRSKYRTQRGFVLPETVSRIVFRWEVYGYSPRLSRQGEVEKRLGLLVA